VLPLSARFFKFISYRDTLVPPEWGLKTYEELKARGVEGSFDSLKNTLHELKKNELLELEKWFQEILPPLESDLNNKL
jgi:predicted esterase